MTAEPIYTIPPDLVVHDNIMCAAASTPWTLPPAVFNPIWELFDGRGCICINLDTGYRKHVDLPEPIAVRNFTGGAASDVTDRHGHGNHTIGSAVGRNGIGGAPGAQLKVGKVLGDNGSGGNTTAGLRWAAAEEGDVISCSWGSDTTQVDSGTQSALRSCEDSGKWVLFAAGNAGYRQGWNTIGSPASSIHCAAVVSIDQNGNPSGFSSGGPRADFAAGGGMIISAGLNNNRVIMSGTSMATPTAAGALLLLRQCMKMLGMDVYFDSRGLVKFLTSEQFLKDAGVKGRDPRYGEGIVTVDQIVSWVNARRLEFA